MENNYRIYTDGGSRGNPGPSGAGGVIIDSNGEIISESSEYLGHQTNNYAEYMGLLLTLKRAKLLGIKKISVFMDSKLIVEQMNGNYKVKNEALKVIHLEIVELLKSFEKVTFTHVYREHNKHADRLVNQAIDNFH
jgi:ribonuclease HI